MHHGRSFALSIVMILMTCNVAVKAVTLSEMYIMSKRVWQNSDQVGGVAPLSGYVCQEIVSQMPQDKSEQGRNYLEVGAGCGTTTEYIVQNLYENDHLVLIEIDPEMCEFLKQRYQNYHNITVCCCSILDWNSDQKYDAIISTLPFNSFDIEFAQKTFKVFKDVAKSHCKVTYVECPIIKQVFKYFFAAEKRHRFDKVQKYLNWIRKKISVKSTTIYLNIPPIEIHHLSF